MPTVISEVRTQRDGLRELLSDAALVQAGAWLAGYFTFHHDGRVQLPVSIRGLQDRCTDVTTPDWPFGADVNASRQALERFAAAEVLERISTDRFRLTPGAKALMPIFPVYHLCRTEKLESRFPQLRAATAGKRILDAGCGTGPYSLLLQSLGARSIVALDYLEDRLKLASMLVELMGGDRIRFTRGSVEALPLADKSVDLVFCRVVLPLVHHERTVSEFARVLAPGGNALLMVHAPSYCFHQIWAGLVNGRPKNALLGVLGLAGGLCFDWFGEQPKWRNSYYLAYERAKSFEPLLRRYGLRVVSWERGVYKPYAWIEKE